MRAALALLITERNPGRARTAASSSSCSARLGLAPSSSACSRRTSAWPGSPDEGVDDRHAVAGVRARRPGLERGGGGSQRLVPLAELGQADGDVLELPRVAGVRRAGPSRLRSTAACQSARAPVASPALARASPRLRRMVPEAGSRRAGFLVGAHRVGEPSLRVVDVAEVRPGPSVRGEADRLAVGGHRAVEVALHHGATSRASGRPRRCRAAARVCASVGGGRLAEAAGLVVAPSRGRCGSRRSQARSATARRAASSAASGWPVVHAAGTRAGAGRRRSSAGGRAPA